MPTIRCTNRLLKLLGKEAVLAAREDDSEDSDLDWYANLFWVEGRKCLIFVNAGTLFPVVALDVLKDDFRDPGLLLRDRYRKLLRHLEAPEAEVERELGLFEQITIGGTRDRTILGSMTQLVKDAQIMIEYGGGMDGILDESLSEKLADTPMKGLGGKYPIDEMRKRIPVLRERLQRPSVPDKGPSEVLLRFMYRPGAHGVVFRYHEMLGFMFYAVTAPGFMDPSEWMMLILGGEEAPFRDMDDVNAVFHEISKEYNRIAEDVMEGRGFDFEYVPFSDDPIDDFAEAAPLHDWATGFAMAFDWAPELWDSVPEEAGRIAGPVIAELAFFASKENAREYMAFRGRKDGDLKDFARSVSDRLPESARILAQLGLKFREVPEPPWKAGLSGDGAPGPPPRVGRNDPCPCGSGKKYKHCHGR
ncbi:MAG: UPF0149 family protein [Rhodothermales bacterium]